MADLDNALQQLRNWHSRTHSQVEKLESAISVLEELIGRNSTTSLRHGIGRGRMVSAAARRLWCVGAQLSVSATTEKVEFTAEASAELQTGRSRAGFAASSVKSAKRHAFRSIAANWSPRYNLLLRTPCHFEHFHRAR